MELNASERLAFLFGIVAVALGAWIVAALRTGKTLYLSRRSAPRMVDRKDETTQYWSMLISLGLLFAAAAAIAVWKGFAR